MSINKDRNIIKRVVEIFNVYPGVDIRQVRQEEEKRTNRTSQGTKLMYKESKDNLTKNPTPYLPCHSLHVFPHIIFFYVRQFHNFSSCWIWILSSLLPSYMDLDCKSYYFVGKALGICKLNSVKKLSKSLDFRNTIKINIL